MNEAVAGGLADTVSAEGDVRDLVNAILENVRSSLLGIHRDTIFLSNPCLIPWQPTILITRDWHPYETQIDVGH